MISNEGLAHHLKTLIKTAKQTRSMIGHHLHLGKDNHTVEKMGAEISRLSVMIECYENLLILLGPKT